jgi:ABC-2 type transport system permease protein
MMADILTVMWKERTSLMRQGGSRARGAMSQLLIVPFLALVLPLQMRSDWLNHSLSLVVSIVVPLLMIATTVPESFAGERERHTLETLLASRLPDRAILLGKLATALLYGLGMTWLTLIMSVAVVNALDWSGTIMFFAPDILLGHVLLSVTFAAFMAGAGVLVSLRSATAMGAQQALLTVIMIPGIVVQIIPVLLLSSRQGREVFQRTLSSLDATTVILVLAAALLLIDMILLWMAAARFERSRLLLD